MSMEKRSKADSTHERVRRREWLRRGARWLVPLWASLLLAWASCLVPGAASQEAVAIGGGATPAATSPTAQEQRQAAPTSPAAPSVPLAPDPRLAHPSLESLTDLPLDVLSPEAASTVAARDGSVGVAVIVPARHAAFVANGDRQLPMASVAKVAIMGAVLQRAVTEDRGLSDEEVGLLEPMIAWSDNDAASQLWAEDGGADGVGQYLDSIGLGSVALDPTGYWGLSEASPRQVALLFSQLAWGDTLDAERRQIAVGLLAEVVPEQRWGMTAGLPSGGAGEIVALKNGWYQDDDATWVVNSAGLVIPESAGTTPYAVVVMARGQPSFEYGVETTEEIAARVNQALLGSLAGGSSPEDQTPATPLPSP